MSSWKFWQSRRHLYGFLAAMAVYVVLMLAVQATLPGMEMGPLAVLWAMAPTVPLAVVVYLTVLQLRDLDEFQQRVQLLALATSTGISLIIATGYGFLERLLDFPDFPLVLAMPVFIAVWWPATLLIERSYR